MEDFIDVSNITSEQAKADEEKFLATSFLCVKCNGLVMSDSPLEGTMHVSIPGKYYCEGILRKMMEKDLDKQFGFDIKLNGKSFHIKEQELSYDDVVKMAYGKLDVPLQSITYHAKGEGDSERSGILTPGKSVKLANRMHFSVYFTGDA